ncbi:hypothetical protein M3148_15505 [Georgenia satyanarayanai]|uniref:AbiTii domain-containing protein n=1 Tax=Georgenia satyanarayanai TaxID=860221 RepID=UPI00203F7DED|nr:hypothetical protein [Georgenia satyanarayanai]MCM3662386.1 hypothetical protein [Georgenia satyanarayanai]
MTDTLLRSLRELMLDESEPLAGLLRKCLLLGAETGSDSLRLWARSELNGYDGKDEVPEYRKVYNVPISMDSISGNTWTKNQVISRLQLPEAAREYVSDEFTFRHPMEELEQLAAHKSLSFSSPGLSMAMTIWNQQLDMFQSVVNMHFVMSGSTVAGMLGQIRTKLVDVVADLTADTPLFELPKKDQVDAAVNHRIGDIYNTAIHAADGPVAIGKAAHSSQGLSADDALRLLEQVQKVATEDVADNERAELLEAVAELRAAVERESPDTGDVVKKVGKLRAIAEKVGVASVTAATGSATQVLTELAVNGAFG